MVVGSGRFFYKLVVYCYVESVSSEVMQLSSYIPLCYNKDCEIIIRKMIYRKISNFI